MKRKLFLLTAIILSFSIVLSACSPRLVGETKAKEIGLGYINQIFDVNETEAIVEYEERPGVTYVNGCYAHYGTEEPHRVYVIKVNPNEIGNARYYAEVNAVTGFAYRAGRDTSAILLTEEQQKQANALGTLDEFNPDTFLDIQKDAMSVVFELLQTRIERDVPIFRVYPDMIESDSVDFPKVLLEYIIIVEDSTVYNLTLCWPSLDLTSVTIMNLDS